MSVPLREPDEKLKTRTGTSPGSAPRAVEKIDATKLAALERHFESVQLPCSDASCNGAPGASRPQRSGIGRPLHGLKI
jgi:hypothetical protein